MRYTWLDADCDEDGAYTGRSAHLRDVPSTDLASRESGQVFVMFLDSDSASLKARIWLEATAPSTLL
jgi:hypothetical protein